MKLLVTGASGFVGGAVWQRASERGWQVCATGRRKLAAAGYVALDLRRPIALDFAADAVVHAAALSSPWGCRRNFEENNVETTRNVIEFCEAHGRPHLVHVSTAAVLYRNEHQLNVGEEATPPAKFVNEYARAKFRSEELVRSYRGTWCILRPRAVFGPGDTVLFPRVLTALRKGRFPRIVSDRPVLGDLVYIDTLAEYVLRAVEKRATGVYHVTNAQPVEVQAFIDRVCAELGLEPPWRILSARRAMWAARLLEAIHRVLPFLGEPPITRFGVGVFTYCKTFNPARTLHDLGPPAVSVEEGLARFISWQRKQQSSAPAPS